MSTRLVADLGGTNVRFALAHGSGGDLQDQRTLACRDYAGFAEAIGDYLGRLAGDAPDSACFAVATVDTGDRIQMTNNEWSFSQRELQGRFGFRSLQLVNDFAAVAMSLPQLSPSQLHPLRTGTAAPGGDLLALGPGTGLGGATLIGGNRVIPCEPGHAGLSPASPLEMEIFRLLLPSRGEIHAEWLVSGPGLERLHQSLAQLRGESVEAMTAPQISAAAMGESDALCLQALETFCALLGSAAGDFTVSSGARGGVFLAGGIVASLLPFLERSDFLQRFTDKGAMAATLREIPVSVIMEPNPGLIGAAAWPLPCEL